MSSLAFRSFDPLFADPFRMARAMFDAPAKEPAELPVRFDVIETDTAFEFEADLPGVAEKDLDITLDGRTLTIAGSRERASDRTEDNRHIIERTFGKFSRSFLLPQTADISAVSAKLDAGVLHVTVGKKAEVKPRKISIGEQAEKLSAAS